MSSLSKVFVKRISGLVKHPNADLLMIGESDGMPFIVNSNDTKDGDLRLIIPFDTVCPPEIWVSEFVRGQRIRPIRLRGVFSMAVCIPLPKGDFCEGEDVTERLGFSKWESVYVEEIDGIILENGDSGYSCKGPGVSLPKYDLESLRKYHREIPFGEPVKITEKLEGENIAIVYCDGQLHVRSRTRWISEGDNKWWQTVRQYDWSWLESIPGVVAFGEKYGNVNKFRYDCTNGEQKIRLFDLFDSAKIRFLSVDDFERITAENKVDTVPVITYCDWPGLDNVKYLAEEKPLLGGDIAEGFVVETVRPIWTKNFVRVKYKLHGEKYLLFKGKQK